MAHGYCLRDPGLIALHSISDGLTALAYFVIPSALIMLVRRRRDLPFQWAYILFGVFILACGATHVLSIVTLWVPVYRLEGMMKALTAVASVGTAILLVRLVPQAVALPGPAQFRHEIEERRRAEAEVLLLNQHLENRVKERTLELQASNAHLVEMGAMLDQTQTIIQEPDGTILVWTAGSEFLYGWTREEALGKKSHELLKTEFGRPFEDIRADLLKLGSWTGEYSQHCKNGSTVWVASYWTLNRGGNGIRASVVKVNSDITALKRTSEALRTSEATARSLFENASQGILTARLNGRIVDANAMAQTLFGYSRAELLEAPVDMLLPENLRSRHLGHHSTLATVPVAQPMGQDREQVARRKDGSEFPVEISLSFVADLEGGLSMAFVSDITARKEAHQERERLIKRLEGALEEKTVLLKEVHHRVKNNMAVIAGLLGMQADTLHDEQARMALAESQQRVMSMALIQEHLYATKHLDRVNFGQYVRQLASELFSSYLIEPDLVAIEVTAEDVELPVHRAIPCGLILNELLCNALKYAFPNGRKGTIMVRFGALKSGDLILTCQDNGVGIPEDYNWRESRSVGLQIINILAKQIDGEITLDRENGAGTHFNLQFPRVPVHE